MLKRRTVGDVKICLRSPQYLALLGALTRPFQQQQLANAVTELIKQVAQENECTLHSALDLPNSTVLTTLAELKLGSLKNTIIVLLNTVN